MTFHEAIDQTIRKFNRPMTAIEIALELNTSKLYTKKDGTDIRSHQVNARVESYPKWFSRNGQQIGLVSGKLMVEQIKRDEPNMSMASPNENRNTLKVTNPALQCKVLLNQKNFRPAKGVDNLVPDQPGIYAIRIRNIFELPKVYANVLEERKYNLLYIGIAPKSLQNGLLMQELRINGKGDFFHSIGKALGCNPLKNASSKKSENGNGGFSPEDEIKIEAWMNKNLHVNWLCMDGGWDHLESQLILDEQPLLNVVKNPTESLFASA